VPRLSLAGDGITVECVPSDPQPLNVNPGWVVSLAIAHPPIAPQPLTSHLHLTINPDGIQPPIGEQLQSVTLPFHYAQTVSNPSILHLLHLLQIEMQAPQRMNQLFVSAIVTVLTTYLLQHWQSEVEE
jgi:hypothetical protein